MKKINKFLTVFAAMIAAATLGGCATRNNKGEAYIPPVEEREENNTPAQTPEITVPETPVQKTATYLRVTGDGVNIRSGAGTSYTTLGMVEKNTLYACLGKSGNWYITKFKDKTAYISEKYCALLEMDESDEECIESVIQSGLRFMGVKYVYGAVRLHDGKGNKLKNFT
ncbi:MAG: SH3 domain-containing protein, partial [Clostridiales bacterium]|nr:SH3 domain-containing protein [Clostridiales bacterium]